MVFGASLKRYIARHSIFHSFTIILSARSGKANLSDWERISSEQTNCFGEHFDTALLSWPTPIISPTDLEIPGNESAFQTHFLGQPSCSAYESGDHAVPLSPGFQDMLDDSEDNVGQSSYAQERLSSFGPIMSAPNPRATWSHQPETSLPVEPPTAGGSVNPEMAQNGHGSRSINQGSAFFELFSGQEHTRGGEASNVKNTRLSTENPEKRSRDKYQMQQDSQGRNSSINYYDSYIDRSFIIFILKQRHEKFYKKLQSEFLVSYHKNGPPHIPHPQFQNIALFPGKIFPVVVRIIKQSNKKCEDVWQLSSKYFLLIRRLYVLQEKWLDSNDIPTYMYRVWQKRLLDWLEGEIFGSDDCGCPIIGIRSSSKLKWTKDDKFSNTRIKLIDYFSHDKSTLEVDKNGKYLFEEFKAKNTMNLPGMKSSSKYHLKENSTKFNDRSKDLDYLISRTNVKKNMGVLFLLVPEKKIFYTILTIPMFETEEEEVLSSVLSDFTAKYKAGRGNIGKKYRTVHPKLSIAMYFQDKNPDHKLFRVLSRDKMKIALKDSAVVKKIRALLRAINYIHLKVCKHLKIDKNDCDKIRSKVFKMLFRMILNPNGQSPPLFGYTTIHGDLAPWDTENENEELLFDGFQPSQIQLIIYLTEDEENLNLKTIAAFILTTCYQDSSLSELQNAHEKILKLFNSL